MASKILKFVLVKDIVIPFNDYTFKKLRQLGTPSKGYTLSDFTLLKLLLKDQSYTALTEEQVVDKIVSLIAQHWEHEVVLKNDDVILGWDKELGIEVVNKIYFKIQKAFMLCSILCKTDFKIRKLQYKLIIKKDYSLIGGMRS